MQRRRAFEFTARGHTHARARARGSAATERCRPPTGLRDVARELERESPRREFVVRARTHMDPQNSRTAGRSTPRARRGRRRRSGTDPVCAAVGCCVRPLAAVPGLDPRAIASCRTLLSSRCLCPRLHPAWAARAGGFAAATPCGWPRMRPRSRPPPRARFFCGWLLCVLYLLPIADLPREARQAAGPRVRTTAPRAVQSTATPSQGQGSSRLRELLIIAAGPTARAYSRISHPSLRISPRRGQPTTLHKVPEPWVRNSRSGPRARRRRSLGEGAHPAGAPAHDRHGTSARQQAGRGKKREGSAAYTDSTPAHN